MQSSQVLIPVCGAKEPGSHAWHVCVFEMMFLYVPIGHSAEHCVANSSNNSKKLNEQ